MLRNWDKRCVQRILERQRQFDFSDYDETSAFYDKTNKKVIDKIDDEAACQITKQFIGLRSKMNSYIKDNNENDKTAKGSQTWRQ